MGYLDITPNGTYMEMGTENTVRCYITNVVEKVILSNRNKINGSLRTPPTI
jgi:hypothetical protein